MVLFQEGIHSQVAYGLYYNFGCRISYSLPLRASVSRWSSGSMEHAWNIPTFEDLLKKNVYIS